MGPNEIVNRGHKAAQILEDPLWKECWEIYESRILEEFKNCKSDDTSRMQQLKMLHLAGLAARKHLESIMEDGKFAQADLEFRKPRPLERLKRVL